MVKSDKRLEALTVRQDATIHNALVKIDSNGLQVVFVVDDSFHLVGVLSDGDIRRALIKERSVEQLINNVMNTLISILFFFK